MEINRRRKRFYPEFYTDKEIEELERQNVQDYINDTDKSDYIGEDITDINSYKNKENGKTSKKEDSEHSKRAGEVKNYNDLLYPENIKLSPAYNKQLDNMQKDYIEKKLNMTKEPTRSFIPDEDVGYDGKNGKSAEPENIYFPEIPDSDGISVEIPDDMYYGIIPEAQTADEPEQSAETTEVTDTEAADRAEETDANITEPEKEYGEYNGDKEDKPEDKLNPDIPVMSYIQDMTKESIESGISDMPETEDTCCETIPETKQEDMAYSEPDEEKLSVEQIEPEEAAKSEQPENYGNSGILNNPKLIPFDKESAIKYALCWALDRNPNFLNFDDMGGDCTNYVSQILLAGGCKMDMTPVLGWYYINGNDKSPSWTGVEQFYKYITADRNAGIVAKEIRLDEAEPGDIVQLSFNGKTFQHTPFITEVNREAGNMYEQIKICAHSFDSKNRSLNTYQWRKIRFIRILGYTEK